MNRQAPIAIGIVFSFVTAAALAGLSRMVPLDDGRTALIEGNALYIIEGGKRVPAPVANYTTRDHEALFVSKTGVLTRAVRRTDGADPRLFLPAMDGPDQSVTMQDHEILIHIDQTLDAFAQQHHVWFHPILVKGGNVTLNWMFCSQECRTGVDGLARNAISSIKNVKSVNGPLARMVCYDGYNTRSGKCAENGGNAIGGSSGN